MTVAYAERLSGWRFILFNIVLSLGHIIVLFNVGAYIAVLPHVTGDLGGVLPSFGTWGQTYFIIALALAFPVARWLSGLLGDIVYLSQRLLSMPLLLICVPSAKVCGCLFRDVFCLDFQVESHSLLDNRCY